MIFALSATFLLFARASSGSLCAESDNLKEDRKLFMDCRRTDSEEVGESVANSMGCNGECRQVETLKECKEAVSRFADPRFAEFEPFTCGDLEEMCEDGGLEGWMKKCKAKVGKVCCGGKALSAEFAIECPADEARYTYCDIYCLLEFVRCSIE